MRAPFLLLLLVGVVQVHAQEADTKMIPYRPGMEHHDELTLLVGYHQGRYGFAEVGVGRNQYGSNHHPYDFAYYLGAELRVDRPELVGVKVGAYVDGGVATGVQLIQYFEGAERCTVFRPEMGIGLFKFKVTYAYNIGLSSERPSGFSTHMLSLTYALRLRRLPKDDQRRAMER